MHLSKNFRLMVGANADPAQVLLRVMENLGAKEEIRCYVNSAYSSHSALIYDGRLGVWTARSPERFNIGADDLFRAVGIESSAGWFEFDVSVHNIESFDDLAPTIVRIVGTVLRQSEGDAILLDKFGDIPRLIRRKGEVIANSSLFWLWDPGDLEPLGLPFKFQHLPKRPGVGFDDSPGGGADEQADDAEYPDAS